MNGPRCCAWLIPLLLAGCAATVAPPPPAALEVPVAWRASSAGAEQPAARVDAQWWQAFGDPALSALVAAALERNGDLRVARARVAEYRARIAVADASRQPSVTLNAAPARTRVLTATGAPHVSYVFAAEFQAGYEIDVWGRLASLTEAARAAYAAEQASADAAALSVAASTASGYLNLRGLDAQLALAHATLRLRAQSRDLARRRFEVGYSSRLEWLQAQAEYQSAAEQIPQLQRQIFELENALSLLTGASPGSIARGALLADLSPPELPAGLPSDLLKRRPDIARAGRNLQAAHATLAATRDQMLPTFRLTAQGGVQSSVLRELVTDPLYLWRLAGMVAGPLFDGGRVQAQTDAAAAQRDQLLAVYENTVRTALAETENGLEALARLQEQAVQNDARRATAAETLRIAHDRYANGYASYLEELDAQRTLYGAEVARLQLKARMLVAAVDLYRALGGGWQ